MATDATEAPAAPSPPPRVPWWRRLALKRPRFWAVLAGTLLGSLLLIGLATWLAPMPIYQFIVTTFEPQLEAELGLDIDHNPAATRRIGNLISLRDVRVREPGAAHDLLVIPRLDIRLRLAALFRRDATSNQVEFANVLQRIDLHDPLLTVRRDARGLDLLRILAERQRTAVLPPASYRVHLERATLRYEDTLRRGDEAIPPLVLPVRGDLVMSRGAISNLTLEFTRPATKETWLTLHGGGDTTSALQGTYGLKLDLAAELQGDGFGKQLGPLLPAEWRDELPRLRSGELRSQGTFVLAREHDDPANPTPDNSAGYAPPRVIGEVHLSGVTIDIPEYDSEPARLMLDAQLTGDTIDLTNFDLRQGPTVVIARGTSPVSLDPEGRALRLLVEDFRIRSARRFLPLQESVQYDGLISLNLSATETSTGTAITGTASSEGVVLAGETFRLETSPVQWRNGVLELDLSARQGLQRLGLSGRMAPGQRLAALNLRAEAIPSEVLRRAFPAAAQIPLVGTVDGTVNYLLDPEAGSRSQLTFTSRNGMLAELPYGGLLGRAHLTGSQVTLERLAFTPPGGMQGAAIAYGTADPGGTLDLHANLGGFDLAQVGGIEGVSGTAFGRVDVTGTLAAPTGHYNGHLLGGRLGPIAFARLLARGSFDAHAITFDEASLVAPGRSATIHGSIDLARARQIDLTSTLKVSAVAGAEQQPIAAQQFTGTLTLSGPLADFAFDLRGTGQLQAGRTQLRVREATPLVVTGRDWGLTGLAPATTWRELVAGLRTQRPALRQGSLTHSGGLVATPTQLTESQFDPWFAATIREAAPELSHLILAAEEGLTGRGPALAGDIALAGEWAPGSDGLKGKSELRADHLAVGEHQLASLILTVERAGPGPYALAMHVGPEESELRLTGTVNPADQWEASVIDLDVRLASFPLEPFLALSAPRYIALVEGSLSGGGPIRGTIGSPTLPEGLDFTLGGGRLADLAPIAGTFQLTYGDEVFQLRTFNLQAPDGFRADSTGSLYLATDRLTESRALFDIVGLDLAKLQPLVPASLPALDGTLELQGRVEYLEGALQGVVTLDIAAPAVGSYRMQRVHGRGAYDVRSGVFEVTEAAPIRVEINPVDHADLFGRLTFTAGQVPRALIHFNAVKLPLGTLWNNPSLISAEGGIDEATLWAAGPLNALQFGGDIILELVDVSVLGDRLLDLLHATIHLEGKRLILGEHQAWLENSVEGQHGKLFASGFIDLDRVLQGVGGARVGESIGEFTLEPAPESTVFPLRGYGLDAGIDLAPFRNASAAASTRLLEARWTGTHVELVGDLAFTEGQLDLSDLPDLARTAGVTASFPIPLDLNFQIRIPRGFRVLGPSDLRAVLDPGVLRVQGHPLAPTVQGMITAPSGSFAILSQEFRFTAPAQLTFDAVYGLNPHLSAEASTQVAVFDPGALSGSREIEVTVQVDARLQELGDEANPGLRFTSSDAAYSDPSSILSLLVGFGDPNAPLAGSLQDRFMSGLTSAAVSVPGQFVGRFFEEQGFQQFSVGLNAEGDVTLDTEIELIDRLAVDYEQRFGTAPEWQGGLRYSFQDNSSAFVGTTDRGDLLFSLDYRMQLGRGDRRESQRLVRELDAQLLARKAELERAAGTLPEGYVARDSDAEIEEEQLVDEDFFRLVIEQAEAEGAEPEDADDSEPAEEPAE